MQLAGAFARGNPPPASRLAALLVAALLSFGPLGLLQVVAWTGMAFDYSARYGLAEGLERTFDGKNPCSMCQSIKQARSQERSVPAAVSSVKKLESFPAPLRAALPPCECREFVFAPWAGLQGPLRADAPPVPIPIAGLV